jgi:hypothetical protein
MDGERPVHASRHWSPVLDDPRRGGRFGLIGAAVLNALPERVRRGLPGWRGVLLWEEAVGLDNARRSRAIAFREGRLIVEVPSSVWMHHLAAVKRNLLARVNAAIGSPVIEDIVFVLGSGPGRPAGQPGADAPIADGRTGRSGENG